HRLGNSLSTPELGLHSARRDVLSARGLEQILLPVGDLQEAVFIKLADVAGFQPTVDQRLPGRLRILEITLEDVVALDKDLAVGCDSDLDPGQGNPNRAKSRLARAIEGRRRGGLG